MFKCVLTFFLAFSITSMAGTPPPSNVGITGGTDFTRIGNVADALKVNITNSPSILGTVTSNQGTAGLSPWLFHFDNTTIGVTGTFFQATQPISAVSLPLPSNAAQETGGHLASIDTKLTSPLSVTGSVGITGTSNVAVTSSVLPTGAATNSQLITINSTLGAPFQTGGSIGNTAFIANAGTNLNTSALALDSTVAKDSSLSTINTSVNTLLKPASTLAAVTSITNPVTANLGTIGTAATASNQTNGSQKSQIVDGSGNVQPSGDIASRKIFIQPTDGTNSQSYTAASEAKVSVTQPIPAGTNLIGKVGIDQTTLGVTNAVSLLSDEGIHVEAFPTEALHVTNDPKQVFDDTYSTSPLDTTDKWNAPVAAGGGVSAVVTAGGGDVHLGTGTTANGYSYVQTQATFKQVAPGYNEIVNMVNLEFPVTANTYRYWGVGTVPATPTASAPVTDGLGFEMSITGKLFAVAYSAGVRTAIQDLSISTGNGKQPQDSAVHKYYIFFRGDKAYWSIDSADTLVATMSTGAPGPINNILPILLLAVANSTPPLSSGVLQSNAIFVGDTAGNSSQISDGTLPYRKAKVDSNGSLQTLSGGHNTAQLIRNDYSSVNVTTAAYVQLVASTTNVINRLYIFDSSGQDFVLAVGAAASEVDQISIPAGGWDSPVELLIPAGSRISIKSKSATASSGILNITGLK